jgi:hypothetical protein
MRTGENDRDYVQSCNQPQLIEKYTRADKIDHNWRNDDSSTQNLNMLIMNAYTAKLIYDITTHNHASQNSQIESYSPSFSSDSSYTDNSSSSDNNTSSPNHE